MPSVVDRMIVSVDKRKKLSIEDKALIKQLYCGGWAIRQLGRRFGVCPRTIQFILFPERLEQNKKLRKERLLCDPHRYYDKKTHSAAVSDLRKRKYLEHPEIYSKICPVCKKRFWVNRSNQIYCGKRCRWNVQNYGNRKNML